MSRSTPTTDDVPAFCQKTPPVKTRIQGTVDFLKSEGIKAKREAIFRYNGVSRVTGFRILRSGNPRTLKNDPTRKETRWRKTLISPQEIHEMERILENQGLEGRALTWKQLGFKVGLDVSEATIRRKMGTMDYHKCLACQQGWQSPKSAANRVEYATVMLQRHSEPEDWDRVRFSNEVHFGWGAQRQLRIIHKPGERYCISCIQHKEEPKAKDEKRFYCWAAAGYNFKSDIIFYDVPVPMGKCLFRSTSTKSWSLLLSHGCWKGMTSHWRKMEIVDMARPKTTTLFEDGKMKTSWSISSTAPLHLIFLPLRIADNLLNNISVNNLTGTIIPQRSWFLKVGSGVPGLY